MTKILRLSPDDIDRARALNALFSDVFEAPDQYREQPPTDAWLAARLADPNMISLVALKGGDIVGGLTAYVLHKLEQERSEIYIYDLAVAPSHWRQGIATALIGHLQDIAPALGAWVIYVQADYGDDPAVALYTKLGTREDVMHFDIAPR
jgi:aminoglycoside 3-N-acetyltransferase I